ncbi:MAG: hypothetical protein PHG91_08585 [Syntrophales bacterium]|nr:hypothetical protein [Syntrophales bacterium]MDD5532225.1 hypothetical protein [Syntrophales bacterium]
MQRDVMTKSIGLCSTCVYSGNCALRRNSSHGVQFCEEYEVENRPAAPPPPPANPFRRRVERPPVRVLGLCSNCDNYPTCSFPKPEAGVWHCEEYR